MIICARPGCPKEAAPGQKYCCREHSPFGHLVGSSTPSRRAPSIYSTREPGGRSEPSSAEGPRTASGGSSSSTATESRPTEPSNESRGRSTMTQTEKKSYLGDPPYEDPGPRPIGDWTPRSASPDAGETTSSGEGSGTPGTPETGSSSEPTSTEEGSLETRLEQSLAPSDSSSAARLTSLNLLDSATEHVFITMKGVGKDNPQSLRDPRVVQAVASCAKQIHSLIRLKLDILKELRGSK